MRIRIAPLLAALGAAAAACVFAQGEYPNRPIRFVVPATPGGGTDILARAVGIELTRAWNAQVVVDNRAGGGGIVGTELVAKAPADGYTILMVFTSHVINPSLYRKLPYDSVQDFAPVTLVASVPNALVVHPSVAAKTAAELVALAKAKPGGYTYGSAGTGSSSHLAGVMFCQMAGVDLVHVPYKGGAPSQTDLIAGQLSLSFANMQSVLPHVRSGRLRALAVTGKTRASTMPEVPSLHESILPGFDANAWFGVLAPAKTPAAVVTKLNAQIVRSLQQPEVRERMAAQGADPQPMTPAEFGSYIRGEITRWGKVVRDSGARAD